MKRKLLICVAVVLLSVLLLTSCGRSALDDGGKMEWSDGIHLNGNSSDSSVEDEVSSGEDDINSSQQNNSSEDTVTSSEDKTTPPDTDDKKNDTSSKNPVSDIKVTNVKNVVRKEATDLRLTEDVLKRSIINQGNMSRVKKVISKAVRGEDVTIGFIGGSITNGSGASSSINSYTNRFKQWWRETFPSSNLTYINAGIGATDSFIGVHRVQTDLLDREPDLVVVEFAVNDKANEIELFREAYESLIRRILKDKNAPAVLQLSMMDQNGVSMQSVHGEIGKHYNIPMISYKNALWPSGSSKVYEWGEIAVDNVHPNDTGHGVASELLIYYINTVRAQIESVSSDDAAIPSPLTKSGFENAALLTSKNFSAKSLGSFKINFNSFYQFPNGWTVSGGKDPITFDVKAKRIYLLYKMDKSSGKAGTVSVKLDSNSVGKINSDASSGWGDHALYYKVADNSAQAQHLLEIALSSSGSKSEFAILGIMIS